MKLRIRVSRDKAGDVEGEHVDDILRNAHKKIENYDRHFGRVETLTLVSIFPNWKVGIRFEGSASSPYSVRFRESLSPTDIHEALLK